MASNLDRYQRDLDSLSALGERLVADLHARHLKDTKQLNHAKAEREKAGSVTFESHYQSWYTEARAVIKQLVPDRLKEFDELYKGDGKQKKVEDGTGFTIQAWLNGARAAQNSRTGEKQFNDSAAVFMRLLNQTQILAAVKPRLESSLFEIRALVQADLLDSGLMTARELGRHGFLRAAGAVAGVVLEKHLGQVRENHDVPLGKAHPTITDLNDLLRKADVIDVPTWRFVQRLGDIRNLCTHNKNREPTADEVDEMLNGVDKIGKTVA